MGAQRAHAPAMPHAGAVATRTSKKMKSVIISMKKDSVATLHMLHSWEAKLMKREAENRVTRMPCRVFMAAGVLHTGGTERKGKGERLAEGKVARGPRRAGARAPQDKAHLARRNRQRLTAPWAPGRPPQKL